jgi:hypothetical protein
MGKKTTQKFGLLLVACLLLNGCMATQSSLEAIATSEDSRPIPSPEPSLTPLPTDWSRFFYYELFWSVPSDWQPLTEELSSPLADDRLVYAASGNHTTSPPWPQSSDGEMLMTLRASVELPAAVELRAISINGHSGWLTELSEANGGVSTRQWLLFVETPSNLYALELVCTPAPGANATDQVNFEQVCEQIWQRMMGELAVMDFGLSTNCPELTDRPLATAWRRVHSPWYRYAFEVPVDWLEQRGPTADRLQFLSEPDAFNRPVTCPLEIGIMALDLAVDAPGNFGTGATGSGPDVTDFTATMIGGHPAWMQTVQGSEVMGAAATGTAVYIQGPEFWYYFWLSCTPATEANAEEDSRFMAACTDKTAHILNSFQILD